MGGVDICQAEQLEFVGKIRPHSALVCIAADEQVIVARSENASTLVPLLDGSHGKHVADVFPPDVCARLTRLNDGGCDFVLPPSLVPPLGGWAAAHHKGGVIFLEIEPLLQDDTEEIGHAFLLKSAICSLSECETLAEAAEVVGHTVREMTDMERVLVYRFEDSGDGEVVAESLAAKDVASFIGFHFPAADIPSQARRLYVSSPARFVPTRDYEPVPIVPSHDPRTGLPFDLGGCHCRSVSPYHRQFQENLGVRGSLSLSVVIKGQLWGLIIGHHRQDHRVPIPARQHAMALAAAFALHIDSTIGKMERDEQSYYRALHVRFLRLAEERGDLMEFLASTEAGLDELFPGAVGVAVVRHDPVGGSGSTSVWRSGRTPDVAAILGIVEGCRPIQDLVFLSSSLGADLGNKTIDFAGLQGIVSIRFHCDGDCFALWFSPEIERTVTWGGATPEMVQADKAQGLTLPRRSFAKWVESRRGQSAAWPKWTAKAASYLAEGLHGIASTARPEIIEFKRRLLRLTTREQGILSDVVAGLTTKEIAAKHGISNRTVDGHRTRITTKLGVSGLSNLTRLALESGFVAPGVQ